MKHFEIICTCGNTTHTDGFYPCDNNGNEIEPTKDWNGLYICGRCGKIHDTKEKLYDLYEQKGLTIEELRKGYRTITGIDNDNELTDEEIYNYMLDALRE